MEPVVLLAVPGHFGTPRVIKFARVAQVDGLLVVLQISLAPVVRVDRTVMLLGAAVVRRVLLERRVTQVPSHATPVSTKSTAPVARFAQPTLSRNPQEMMCRSAWRVHQTPYRVTRPRSCAIAVFSDRDPFARYAPALHRRTNHSSATKPAHRVPVAHLVTAQILPAWKGTIRPARIVPFVRPTSTSLGEEILFAQIALPEQHVWMPRPLSVKLATRRPVTTVPWSLAPSTSP